MTISQLNGQERLRAAYAVAALRTNAPSTPATSAAAARQTDAVSLSDTARSLAAARHAVEDASDVRTDRVAALKAAIADGTYAVDSRQLARSLLKSLGR